jgi:excisionase family DNA binding protein
MTITEAAEFLGVSVSTLRNWDRAGKLRAARNPMNRYRLYEKADLEKVLLSLQASRRKAAKGKKTGIVMRRSARRRRISYGSR